jgi:hypothetical protein
MIIVCSSNFQDNRFSSSCWFFSFLRCVCFVRWREKMVVVASFFERFERCETRKRGPKLLRLWSPFAVKAVLYCYSVLRDILAWPGTRFQPTFCCTTRAICASPIPLKETAKALPFSWGHLGLFLHAYLRIPENPVAKVPLYTMGGWKSSQIKEKKARPRTNAALLRAFFDFTRSNHAPLLPRQLTTAGMWAPGRPNGLEKMKMIIFSRFERRASKRFITAIREVESSNSADRKDSAPLFSAARYVIITR